MNTALTTTTNRFARITRVALATLVASVIGTAGVSSSALAQPVQVYHSTPINGMWHSGNTQYLNGNVNFNLNVYFNDRPGDAFCTQLKYRAYTSNGASVVLTGGSVCGGRSGTIGRTLTAGAGTTITKVEIWTVRADGGARSYVWSFWP